MKIYPFLICFLFVQINCSDHKLIRIHLKSDEDVKLVQNFKLNNFDKVDLWQYLRANSSALAQLKGNTLKKFRELNIDFEVANQNITKLNEKSIEDQKKRQKMRNLIQLNIETFNLNEYHSYSEIKQYLKNLRRRNSSTVLTKMILIGTTYERRMIFGMIISKKDEKKRKILLIECNIHAREWVSGAACLKMIDKFAVDQDETSRRILDDYEVHIIPILNPDGYEYSRNSERDWRKNRARTKSSSCIGVDLNRNFNYPEFVSDYSNGKKSCDETFPGSEPFSEKETQALRDYVLSIKDSLYAYLSVHSFSQLVMYPYGYKNEFPKNNDELKRLAESAREAIRSKQGQIYKIGNIYGTIYETTGNSVDWIMDNTDSKLNFVFEMRDTGNFGFMLPEELIEPAFKDIWIGLRELTVKN